MRPATLMKFKPVRDAGELEIPMPAEDARVRAATAELAALQVRMQESKRREDVARARSRGQQPTSSVATRAKALLAGGRITAATPEAELQAALDEQTVLGQAIQAQTETLRTLVSEFSAETIRKHFAAPNAEFHLHADAAAEALFHNLQGARVLRSRLLVAGYDISSLPYHQFPVAVALGDPRVSGSGMNPAWSFRQWLREKGIV